MALEQTQAKPGYPRAPSRNDKNAGSRGTDPLAGKGLSTGYQKVSSAKAPEDRGRLIEGQEQRGYVLNQGGRNISPPKDATVAPDGTRRVRQV